jgi:nitrogenase molybdenum-iron protein alpha/beta subunit
MGFDDQPSAVGDRIAKATTSLDTSNVCHFALINKLLAICNFVHRTFSKKAASYQVLVRSTCTVLSVEKEIAREAGRARRLEPENFDQASITF